jgi:hypothetical protein
MVLSLKYIYLRRYDSARHTSSLLDWLKLSRQPLLEWTLHLCRYLCLNKSANGESSASFDVATISVHVTFPPSVSVPMRSFQGGELPLVLNRASTNLECQGYYPQLIQLYKKLGVAFRQADFSYSFSLFSPSTSTSSRKITTTMIYNGASGREGVSMPSVMNEVYLQTKGNSMAVRTIARVMALAMFILMTIQMMFNYLRLILLSIPFLRPRRLEHLTFREWTANSVPTSVLARLIGLDTSWKDFTKHVLVPLFSAVCTTSETDVMEHPMEEFLGKYFHIIYGSMLQLIAIRLCLVNVWHPPLRSREWRQ